MPNQNEVVPERTTSRPLCCMNLGPAIRFYKSCVFSALGKLFIFLFADKTTEKIADEMTEMIADEKTTILVAIHLWMVSHTEIAAVMLAVLFSGAHMRALIWLSQDDPGKPKLRVVFAVMHSLMWLTNGTKTVGGPTPSSEAFLASLKLHGTCSLPSKPTLSKSVVLTATFAGCPWSYQKKTLAVIIDGPRLGSRRR